MDIGTVNFDDLFDFSPEPPPAQEKGGESWERESARLTGDWGQGQQRLNTVRTITSAAAQAQHQHNQVSHMARHEAYIGGRHLGDSERRGQQTASPMFTAIMSGGVGSSGRE